MKVPRRDYFTIAAALLAILLCGYGVGFLVGERLTQRRFQQREEAGAGKTPWEDATLARLTAELELSEPQREQVRREILAASQNINRARLEAVSTFRAELLDLHLRILPYLDENQKTQVEESSRRLKKMLDVTP